MSADFTFSDFAGVLSLDRYNTRLVVVSTFLLGVSGGLAGALLLLRKRSLLGDVLSHATLPGIGIAFALSTLFSGSGKQTGILLAGAAVSGIAGILVMALLRRFSRLRDDVAMGIVMSVFFGAGIAILQMVRNLPDASGLESFIYGKTASMVAADFAFSAGAAGLVIVGTWLLFKEFTLLCFDENYAASQGWPVGVLDALLLGLVAVVTVTGLQAVGLILVIAFLIIPAASARFWTEKLGAMMWISALLGGASGWLGASASALLADLPAGAVIVLAAAFFFLVSMVFGKARGILPRWREARKLQRRVDRQHLLRAVYELLERAGTPVENKSVTQEELRAHRGWPEKQLARLLVRAGRDDLLERTGDAGRVRLSEAGFGEAARVTRNHRLWEIYLIKHADIAPNHVDRDADTVEHILGAKLVRSLEAELKPAGEVPGSPHEIVK